jgi:hypothetical protein
MLSTSALRPPGAAQPGQGQGQGQAADAQTQFARLTARIEGIAAAWNAAGPGCQFQVSSRRVSSSSFLPPLLFLLSLPYSAFLSSSLYSVFFLLTRLQYIFYNRVDPAQVGLYGRPPNATNDALWARAVRENPDPSWCVALLFWILEGESERAWVRWVGRLFCVPRHRPNTIRRLASPSFPFAPLPSFPPSLLSSFSPFPILLSLILTHCTTQPRPRHRSGLRRPPAAGRRAGGAGGGAPGEVKGVFT